MHWVTAARQRGPKSITDAAQRGYYIANERGNKKGGSEGITVNRNDDLLMRNCCRRCCRFVGLFKS